MVQELKPEVMRRLEQSVMDIFSSADFHKATMRAVAKQAGISFSTIYAHFGSKERLLFTFVDLSLGKLTERIIDHLQGIEDLKEKLRKVVWLQLDYYQTHEDLGRILFMTVPMQTWMADDTFRQRRMIGMFMDVLRQGQASGMLNNQVRAGVLLDFMMGFVQRSFVMWISRGKSGDLAADAGRMSELIWRAIANPEVEHKRSNRHQQVASKAVGAMR